MEPTKVADAVGADGKPVADTTPGQVDWAGKAKELETQLTATQASIDALKSDSDRNVRRLQSTYQQQLNALRSQSEEEKGRWEEAYHSEKMAGMEGDEALRYENSRLAELVRDRETRLEQMQRQAAEAQAAAGYLQKFSILGVPVAKLNVAGSLQELEESGFQALQELRTQDNQRVTEMDGKLNTIQTQLDALRKGEAPLDPNKLAETAGDLKPPKVATHTHGEIASTLTEAQALTNAEKYFGFKPTLEQLYRAVETKQLPPTVLPGLEGMPREE